MMLDIRKAIMELSEPSKAWLEYKGYITRKVIDGEWVMTITDEGWLYLRQIFERSYHRPVGGPEGGDDG
jgi:hypothetical protein